MTEAGSPLYVEYRGHDRSPGVETFLLIHGFGASSYTWRHWSPALERRGRVLLVDMKGFGVASKPDDGRYGPEDQASLIGDLIEEEDPDRLTLVGHSMGGGIALLTALSMTARGDRRLVRLVIVSGAAYEQRLPPFVALARFPRLARLALRAIGAERVMKRVLHTIVRDRRVIDSGQVEAYAAALRTPEGVRAALDAAGQLVPERLGELSARYPEISVPCLLIWGRQDRVVPLAIGTRLAADLPNARLEVLEECGHLPHEEHPNASTALLEAFLG